jgi:hypothetical protein
LAEIPEFESEGGDGEKAGAALTPRDTGAPIAHMIGILPNDSPNRGSGW